MYIPPFVILGTIILGILAWVLWLWLGKMQVSIHRVALLATAIPQALLVIAFVVLFLLTAAEMRALSDIWVSCFYVSFGIATAAFLSSVISAIVREWEIAKGTSLGGGIGFVVSLIAFFVAFSLYA